MDFKDIKERFEQARDDMSEQRSRMVEDLRFSNPADPQQWDETILRARKLEAMPCYTFDQTNQYVAQVVNDSRMNKPQIMTVPASSGADQKVSDVLDGMIRQIEYASDAAIAYDVAQEAAARVGRGWFRLLTEVVDPKMNLQELRIRPVIDSLSVVPGDYTMPDGSDMSFGFVETRLPLSVYAARYGKSKTPPSSWSDWEDDETIRIAEYFEVVKKSTNTFRIRSIEGQESEMSEEDYWKTKDQTGVKPGEVQGNFASIDKTVKWYKLNGDDFIEESTTFPGMFVPLFPVHGYETWIEGKRYLCGMVRRMRDSQIAYNLDRSSEILLKSLQPKSPYLMAFGAVEGLENFWSDANSTNRSYLPYNHVDEAGNAYPKPERIAPPQIGQAYIQGSQQALSDLQASVGMYRANLGAPSNETSGIAIKRREQQGDTANFHYIDNLARTMGHCGRVIVGAIPTVYADSSYGPRDVRSLGVDGTSQQIIIDPGLGQSHTKDQQGQVTINPSTGKYDVRVKVGPAYANMREELSQRLTEISSGNPQLGAALAPLLTQMMDMPESEKVSKICLALLPPQVQAAYNDDGQQPDIPPQVMQQLQQLQQERDQARQALIQAHQEHTDLEQQMQSKTAETQAKGEVERQKIAITEHFANLREQMKTDLQKWIVSQNNAVKLELGDRANVASLIEAHIEPPPQIAAEVDPSM